MLPITVITEPEQWDESTQEFVPPKTEMLMLEHSLVSLSKWERKHHKAFLSKTDKTLDETIDYIKCMTLNENVDEKVYQCLSNSNIRDINNYIEDPMTATYISDNNNSAGSRETVTAELIYYWMISLTIPFECQYWHLNSLLTLIKVCNVKNSPPKIMSRGDIMRRNASLNAARKQQYNTKG